MFEQEPIPLSNDKKRTSRNLLVISLLLLTIVLVAAAVYSLSVRNLKTDENVVNPSTVEQISAVTPGQVELTSTGITPEVIEVKTGQQVTFINKDAAPHRLVANKDILKDFDSGEMLQTGETYTYVFDTPGVYGYYDYDDGIKYSGTVDVR